jgi:quinol monooxygenase YgiN
VPGLGRYMKFTAQPGVGDKVAELLLRTAESLGAVAGCELYVVNRSIAEPDVVWVTELWMSQEALDASLGQLDTEEGRNQVAEVMSLLAGPPERIDLEPLGGVGYLTGGGGYTHLNLEDVEDMAARFGLEDRGEARFANREEVVVVLAGGGKVKIDDDIMDVRALDAIRIAPSSARAFEAGPDGLEFLVFGVRHPGDAVMDRDFWPAEVA